MKLTFGKEKTRIHEESTRWCWDLNMRLSSLAEDKRRQTADHQILGRINKQVNAPSMSSLDRIGKPDQLKYGTAGAWFWLIAEEHRLG